MRSRTIRAFPSPLWLLCAAFVLTLGATAAHATVGTKEGTPDAPRGVAPGTIGDFVWDDLNGNGLQDPGEPGIPNVIVFLTAGDGTFITEKPTDATGHYEFDNLLPGDYHVGVKNPCPNSPSGVGDDPSIDSNPNPPGGGPVTLAEGQSNLDVDFGLECGPVQGSCSCTLGYPDNSNLPRSSAAFNESNVLVAWDPGADNCATAGSVIKLWYSDEHAMTLGVSKVVTKTKTGTTTNATYSVTPYPGSPACVTDPDVGATDANGNDTAPGGGRPLWPALFITDVTSNPSARDGDWQQGGTGVKPSEVCGLWKGAVRTIDLTHVDAKHPDPEVKITPDQDPAKISGKGIPSVIDPFPTPSKFKNEGYLTEVKWNVSDLGLVPGHSYRLQFMVHDGDQNKVGGDVGEGCTTANLSPEAVLLPSQNGAMQAKITVPGTPTDVGVALGQPIPNPFRGSTRFSYRVDRADARVDIGVFDLSGRRIRSLVSGAQSVGEHQSQWDGRADSGSKVNRGVYFLRALIGNQVRTTQVMYLQ